MSKKSEMFDHCVIGAKASGRTWGNEEGTIRYAQKILAQKGAAPKLFVVKVVKVIELSPPPTTVRDFDNSDIA